MRTRMCCMRLAFISFQMCYVHVALCSSSRKYRRSKHMLKILVSSNLNKHSFAQTADAIPSARTYARKIYHI